MYFWQQWKILSQLQRLPRHRLVQLTEMLQGKEMGMTEPAAAVNNAAAAASQLQHLRRHRNASMQAQTEGLGQEDTMLGLKQVGPTATLGQHPRRDFDPSMQAHADGLGQQDTMFAAHAKRSMSTASEQQAPSVRKSSNNTATNNNGKKRDETEAFKQLLSPDAPQDALKRATSRLNPQEKMHLRQLVLKAMA